MKLSAILLSTVAAQTANRVSRSIPAELQELIDLDDNDRLVTSDSSLRSIENVARYLISADQALGSGMGLGDWVGIYVSSGLKATVKEMFEYGCWGQVFNEIQGYGEPVDAFDQLAKDWRHCRACTQSDHGCPKRTNSKTAYYPWRNAESPVTHPVSYSCVSKWGHNETDCKRAMCSCDVHFATEMAKLYSSGERINPAYHGSGFDHAAQCGAPAASSSSSSGRPGPAKQCCGTYPQRATYDADHHDCCANALLVAIGECA